LGGKSKIVGFVLTAIFLGVVLWKVDLSRLGPALASANYFLVLPALIFTTASYGLRTLRWRAILWPTKVIPFQRLYPVLMIGFMANNVLPARLGEFVRAYVLGRKERVSSSLGFATIMLERLLDGLVLLGFLLGLSFLMPIPGWGIGITYVGSVVFTLAAVFVLVVLLWEGFARQVLNQILRPLPSKLGRGIADRIGLFISGLHALRSNRTALIIFGLSIVVWSVETAYYFLILRGFGIGRDPAEMLRASILVLVVVNLGIMIPSAPGYVGTFHALTVLGLSAFGVDPTLAFSVAVVFHGLQYLFVTSLGFFFLGRENLSIGQLWRRGDDDSDSDGGGSNGKGPAFDSAGLKREAGLVPIESKE
jgi:glycosyltransferase 2 family protein